MKYCLKEQTPDFDYSMNIIYFKRKRIVFSESLHRNNIIVVLSYIPILSFAYSKTYFGHISVYS